MKKLFALVLALMMVMACFAGCNEKTSADGDKKKETIVVGYTLYAPMNYKDDAGNLIGFDTELAKAVFEKLGYDVIFKEIDWDARYTDLASGTIDCIWNGFTANTADKDGVARSEKVDFSYNYMENRQVIVAKTSAGFTTKESLAGKIAGVESGSAGESYAEGFTEVTVKGFGAQMNALMEVKSGTVDFAVLDERLAASNVGKGDYADLTIVAGLESDLEYYAIGFSKGSELTAKVNAQLEALADDGTLVKLAEKYGVENKVITDFSSQK